jgi:hypothetical protein
MATAHSTVPNETTTLLDRQVQSEPVGISRDFLAIGLLQGGEGPQTSRPELKARQAVLYRAGRYWALTAGAFWSAATH